MCLRHLSKLKIAYISDNTETHCMLRIEDAKTHWEQRQTPQPKARKSLLPTVGRYLYFQIWLSRIKHYVSPGTFPLQRWVKLVMKLAGACRRTVGRRTNHAVEGQILNLFLVWTQWSATEGHGGVERWKTRTDEEEKTRLRIIKQTKSTAGTGY